MKFSFSLSLLLFSLSSITIFAQTPTPSPTPNRPRVIVVGGSNPVPAVSPTPKKVVVVTNNTPQTAPTPYATPRPSATPLYDEPLTPSYKPVVPSPVLQPKTMGLGLLRSRINEAKRLMQTRPMTIGMTDNSLVTDVVRMAFFDWKTNQIDFVPLTKTIFLEKNIEFPTQSTNGRNITVRILRANGVNTAITIVDDANQPQTPLVVQYPIERGGQYVETAYYISTHPGVVNSEVVSAGKMYVRNTVDIARAKLKEKGFAISPEIADIAERLITVEHVDHPRFWNEPHPKLYDEIFTLYAMNEGNTYRYSVSRAGAGGMVQMIPATYYMVRSRYYTVGLIPDFVEGMRNHVNATQAMLLYMQMTWNDLASRETVINALESGIATQSDLMAAGYNSNPARLPIYIKRGGARWRTLIPKETKIYLQIYASLERAVPMTPRTN